MTFDDALSKWREMGGHLSYTAASSAGSESWHWSDDFDASAFNDDETSRSVTEKALRAGGMSESQIAEEMRDFCDFTR